MPVRQLASIAALVTMRSLLLLLAIHSARAADDAEMAALRAAKTELQDTVAEDERYDALLRRQEELYKRTGMERSSVERVARQDHARSELLRAFA